MLVVSKLFNIAFIDVDEKKSTAFSDADEKKSARCNLTRCKRDPMYLFLSLLSLHKYIGTAVVEEEVQNTIEPLILCIFT